VVADFLNNKSDILFSNDRYYKYLGLCSTRINIDFFQGLLNIKLALMRKPRVFQTLQRQTEVILKYCKSIY